MKQIKKLASLLLAAVLAMTLLAGCGGRGGNVSIAVTEQSILKYINEARAEADKGLSPVKNDPTLANAAAKLLEAYAQTEMVKTYYGTGYKMTKNAAENILRTATGKKNQGIKNLYSPSDGSYFYLAPDNYYVSPSNNDLHLFRRGDKVFDSENGNAYNGLISTIEQFCPASVIMARDVKVGIAFREINGERFALLVYDVTITT
ncbi:MAG: CAP domain-containing protein [Faecalibacterium prausnitzii]